MDWLRIDREAYWPGGAPHIALFYAWAAERGGTVEPDAGGGPVAVGRALFERFERTLDARALTPEMLEFAEAAYPDWCDAARRQGLAGDEAGYAEAKRWLEDAWKRCQAGDLEPFDAWAVVKARLGRAARANGLKAAKLPKPKLTHVAGWARPRKRIYRAGLCVRLDQDRRPCWFGALEVGVLADFHGTYGEPLPRWLDDEGRRQLAALRAAHLGEAAPRLDAIEAALGRSSDAAGLPFRSVPQLGRCLDWLASELPALLGRVDALP
jgi:hypothetical protein